MVVDTSALLAILFQESDALLFARTIGSASRRFLSAANVVEAGIVLGARSGEGAEDDLDELVQRYGLIIEPVTSEQAWLARRAYRRFGRGNHPASLNFGDCFAYALSVDKDEPLLFKGADFSQTDVSPAL